MLCSVKQCLYVFILLVASANLAAQTISLKASNNIMVTANYQEGDEDKPIIIFVHGFLQTQSFSTVNRLFTALQDNGYPVLSLTLSLGISNRTGALACESLHLHSLQDDSDEIDLWVNWAHKNKHKNIILIGHSAGSSNITHYLSQNPHPSISKTILISLTHYGPDRPAAFETQQHAEKARAMLLSNNMGLEKFALAFCSEYVSTAKNFLSYYEWSEHKAIDAINKKKPKNYIILGGKDDRIGTKWENALQASSAQVHIIEGANHFFDQSHEFDLLETIEDIL